MIPETAIIQNWQSGPEERERPRSLQPTSHHVFEIVNVIANVIANLGQLKQEASDIRKHKNSLYTLYAFLSSGCRFCLKLLIILFI